MHTIYFHSKNSFHVTDSIVFCNIHLEEINLSWNVYLVWRWLKLERKRNCCVSIVLRWFRLKVVYWIVPDCLSSVENNLICWFDFSIAMAFPISTLDQLRLKGKNFQPFKYMCNIAKKIHQHFHTLLMVWKVNSLIGYWGWLLAWVPKYRALHSACTTCCC